MKWYSITKIGGSLFEENPPVQAKNSKEAIEKYLDRKVMRINKYPDHESEYSVIEGNEQGQIYKDRRKWLYYKVLTK